MQTVSSNAVCRPTWMKVSKNDAQFLPLRSRCLVCSEKRVRRVGQ